MAVPSKSRICNIHGLHVLTIQPRSNSLARWPITAWRWTLGYHQRYPVGRRPNLPDFLFCHQSRRRNQGFVTSHNAVWPLSSKQWRLFVFFVTADCVGRWQWRMLKKRVLRVSVNLLQVFSCTSFLHAIEHSSVPAQNLSSTWHKPCNVIGRPVVVVQETVTNLHQIFVQVSCTSFVSVCRQHNSIWCSWNSSNCA